jgi:hypothetical protein
MREMKVRIGTFARTGIESQTDADLAQAVETAVYYYAGKLESGRPPVPLPRELDIRPNCASEDDGGDQIELNLDPDIETLMRREAYRQGSDIDSLTAHSVMVYLAELDLLSAAIRS